MTLSYAFASVSKRTALEHARLLFGARGLSLIKRWDRWPSPYADDAERLAWLRRLESLDRKARALSAIRDAVTPVRHEGLEPDCLAELRKLIRASRVDEIADRAAQVGLWATDRIEEELKILRRARPLSKKLTGHTHAGWVRLSIAHGKLNRIPLPMTPTAWALASIALEREPECKKESDFRTRLASTWGPTLKQMRETERDDFRLFKAQPRLLQRASIGWSRG